MRTACVIVGAGPSGLEMSRHCSVDHVVLEKDRIAETWRTQRWDSLRLNTPGYINGMLGNVAPNDFSTAAEVVSLLEQRAAEAPIREHSPAQSMHRDGDDYVLQTTDGEYRAGNVIVATGNQNVPRIPPMSNQLPDDIHQLHAAAYRKCRPASARCGPRRRQRSVGLPDRRGSGRRGSPCPRVDESRGAVAVAASGTGHHSVAR